MPPVLNSDQGVSAPAQPTLTSQPTILCKRKQNISPQTNFLPSLSFLLLLYHKQRSPSTPSLSTYDPYPVSFKRGYGWTPSPFVMLVPFLHGKCTVQFKKKNKTKHTPFPLSLALLKGDHKGITLQQCPSQDDLQFLLKSQVDWDLSFPAWLSICLLSIPPFSLQDGALFQSTWGGGGGWGSSCINSFMLCCYLE